MKLKVCKILTSLLIIMLLTLVNFRSVFCYSYTGHKDFEEIYFPEYVDAYLLVNTTKKMQKENIKKVPWKLFGPSVYVRHYNIPVKYKKYDIFTRSNKTSNALEYEYKYTTTFKHKSSIDYKETGGADVGVKIDIINASIDSGISKAININTETSISGELNYTIIVDPYTKVTVYLTGDAYLSQGAAIYYFFGIPIVKKNWEFIDVLTEYYEFYEESYI